MLKKLMSVLLAAMTVAASATVFADDGVSVYVNNRAVGFEDQVPVIYEDRTLVPLRGVLNAMNAKVEWDGEKRQVTVNSEDNRTRLILTIDEKEITVLDFISITTAKNRKVESDVAPMIMNDRTMIPLRVISETMGADVSWDPETKTVSILTKKMQETLADKGVTITEETDLDEAFAVLKDETVNVAMTADKTTVAKGEDITLTVELSNTAVREGKNYIATVCGILYDSTKYEYKNYSTYIGGVEVEEELHAGNAEFMGDSLRIASLIDNDAKYPIADGAILKVVFTALSDEEASFALSDRYTSLGYDTVLTLQDDEGNYESAGGTEIVYVDTTPITVNN